MGVAVVILSDFDADILDRLPRTPHPTIPEADLAALDRALKDVTGKVRVNLRAAERCCHHGGTFERVRDVWQTRLHLLLWVRLRLNDARVRHEDVEMVRLWEAVESVRERLHERVRIA